VLYWTRYGGLLRVICIDAHPVEPIVSCDSSGRLTTHFQNGKIAQDKEFDDLVAEYVEPPKAREFWVRIEDTFQGRGSVQAEKWLRVREVLDET
jgi:hypothetical protein